jgi:glyceraldehyde 3-phosphate dehydrogenase
VSVNGHKIRLTSISELTGLPWGEIGVDVAVEATGKFTTKEDAEKHKLAGAKKVIISAPGTDVPTIVAGVNTQMINPNDDCFSGASCTTGSIAPPLKVLLNKFGIESFTMVTTHAFTNDQVTLNGTRVGADERGLTASANTSYTSTGAAKAISEVLPELKGKGDGFAYRVAIPNGSFTALSVVVSKDVTVQEINQALQEAAASDLKGIMDVEQGPLSSQDILGTHVSSIIDAQATKVVGKRQVLISAGYDNEFGYPNRLLDLIAAVNLNDQRSERNDGIVKRDIPPAIVGYIEEQRKKRRYDPAMSSLDQAALAQKDESIFRNTMSQAAALKEDPLGGINLDPALYSIQIKRDGMGIPLPVNQQTIDKINISGIRAVIQSVTPANLPLMLGIAQTSQTTLAMNN